MSFSQIQPGSLAVPGATLQYEIRNHHVNSPVILLIPGCTGINIFAAFAAHLASLFTVISYERRGYAGSIQAAAPAPDVLMKVNGDDAAALIRHLSPGTPVTVFATSGGAMVSFELIRRHGSLVRTLILHEPPVMSIVPATELPSWEKALQQTSNAYLTEGIKAAIETFGKNFANEEDARGMAMAMLSEESLKDSGYFLVHEMKQVSIYKLDLDVLVRNKEKLILAGGRDSKECLPHRPIEVIGEQLGLQVFELAGGHVGYGAPHTCSAFASDIMALLVGMDHGCAE